MFQLYDNIIFLSRVGRVFNVKIKKSSTKYGIANSRDWTSPLLWEKNFGYQDRQFAHENCPRSMALKVQPGSFGIRIKNLIMKNTFCAHRGQEFDYWENLYSVYLPSKCILNGNADFWNPLVTNNKLIWLNFFNN